MRLSVSEAAKRAGVSVRTLRWYDEIGLLKPSETTRAGYRFYDDAAMAALQQSDLVVPAQCPHTDARALRRLAHG